MVPTCPGHTVSHEGVQGKGAPPTPGRPRRMRPGAVPPSARLSPVYSATEASEDAADAVSQSLSVLRLGLRLSTGKASRDSTLLGRGTGQGWEGGRHTASRLRRAPAGGTPARNGPGCTTSTGWAGGRSGEHGRSAQENTATGHKEPTPEAPGQGRATLRRRRGAGHHAAPLL